MCSVAGRYESWFLSARDVEPGRLPRALWIRHTSHRPADADQASGALWCTVFDPDAGAPAAVKQSLPQASPGGAGPHGFRGEARARGRMAEWNLTAGEFKQTGVRAGKTELTLNLKRKAKQALLKGPKTRRYRARIKATANYSGSAPVSHSAQVTLKR